METGRAPQPCLNVVLCSSVFIEIIAKILQTLTYFKIFYTQRYVSTYIYITLLKFLFLLKYLTYEK